MPDIFTPPDIATIQARFEEHYHRIHQIASYQHRKLHGDDREEAVADTIALAWRAYRRMALQGGDPGGLIGPITRYSARHVRNGQLLTGKPPVNDVMSRLSRKRHGHFVTGLPSSEDDEVAAAVHDALRDGRHDPAEEAAWRIYLAERLGKLSDKERSLVEALEQGYTLTEIAERRGVSHQAVHDMRRTVARKWAEGKGRG